MIRKVSKKEFLRFLRDESVAPRLDARPDKIRVKNTYVVESGDCRLYFFFEEVEKDAVEMHVGAIKRHRKNAVSMIKKALDFVKLKGYKKVITWAPEIYQSTINMALGLDFAEVGRKYHAGYNCNAVYLARVL